MSPLGWLLCGLLCLLCFFSQRTAAASLSAIAGSFYSPQSPVKRRSGKAPISAAHKRSGCAACGFRLCHCITKPAAAFRSMVQAAPYIAYKTGTGFLEGGLLGFVGSAAMSPFVPSSVKHMKETTMTMAKFGAARKGGSALLEAIRETDDGWNDVAANMLAGAYMLSPTTNIWDRCLTGAACGGLTFLARQRKAQHMPSIEQELKARSSWEQDQHAW